MSQQFLDFMHTIENATKDKRTITRKPLLQLLYLHKLIDPYITILSRNSNFLHQTLSKEGIILSYVHHVSRQNIDSQLLHALEKQLNDLIIATQDFMDEIKKFRKSSSKYLKDLDLVGIIEHSDKILEDFIKEYSDMEKTFKGFKYLLKKIMDIPNNSPELQSHEQAAMRTFCYEMDKKWLNAEAWIKRLRKLKYEYYFKNGAIAREFALLKKASEDEQIINQYIININNYQDFLRNGDVIMSYKLYNYIRKDWFTKVVNRVTKSAATHAGIYYNGKVAEARQNGSSVRLNDIHSSKNEVLLVFRPNINNEQIRQICERIEYYCQLENGRPKYGYNWKGLAGFLVARKHKWLSGFLPADKAFFCSEFVAQVFNDIGVQLSPFKQPSLVSPKDIFESKLLKFIYILDATKTFRNVEEEKKDFQDMLSQAKKLLDENMVGVQY